MRSKTGAGEGLLRKGSLRRNRFATEEDCVRFLFEKRWPEGWTCPKCGNNKCYPIEERGLYECAAYRYQASVTAGTILN